MTYDYLVRGNNQWHNTMCSIPKPHIRRIYEGTSLRGNEVEHGGKTLSLKEEDTS
jgi:hypothetical protein